MAFFDAQDLPLTLTELVNYFVAPSPSEEREGLKVGVRLSQIEQTLQTELADRIGHDNGFYFLRGRSELVSLRNTRYRVSLQRFRKARKYLYWLGYIPYLRAVAISGSQALLNSTDNSDIDLFVITKKNRIWLARFLVSLYFQILGQRRYGAKIASRFCLNHYIEQDQSISQDQNLYTAVEYASLIPVFGKGELVKFWQKNDWISSFLASAQPEAGSHFFNFQFSAAQTVIEAILDYTIGPVLNFFAGLYQKRRIKLQEHILATDRELSFHPGSRGQKVLARFEDNLARFEA